MIRRTSVDGPRGRLSALVGGAGSRESALLLVHPANLQGAAWLPVAERLGEGRTWIAPDLRGHGHSARRGPFDVAAWAADAWAVVEAAGAHRIDVVGASVGAAVAVELAREHADAIASITTIGGAFLPAPEHRDALLEGLAAGRAHDVLRRRAAEQALAPGAPRPLVDRVQRDMTINDAETMAALWRGALATDVRPVHRHAGIRYRVVVGELDQACPPAESAWFAEAVGTDATVLAGVGHLPMYEAPERVAAMLTEHERTTA